MKILKANQFPPTTHKKGNTANSLCKNHIHFVCSSELLCFLSIIQSDHMWNTATSLHSLINLDRQKNAGGRNSRMLVFSYG